MRRSVAACLALGVLFAAGCGDKIDAIQTLGVFDFERPVTYQAHVAPLMTRCLSCHGPGKAMKGVRLDSLASVRANADLADEAMQSGRMPPTGGLPQRDRELFSAWIVDGMLDQAPALGPLQGEGDDAER